MQNDTRASFALLRRELETCLIAMAASEVAASTTERVTPVIERFCEFLGSHGVVALRLASPSIAESFVRARLQSGLIASGATMHDRRSTLRLLFRFARRLGLVDGDPTLDVLLPPRSSRRTRPLIDDEVELARDVALWSLASRRVAASWALAEATARGRELSCVVAGDVDLRSGRVWLHGGKRTLARWGSLTEWGSRVLRGRLAEINGGGPVVYEGGGRGAAGEVSTCSAISTVLVRAGLAGEPDVRPASVAAWAARRQFDAGAGIGEVARNLGVRSLDQAAQIIGWDWNQ